MISTVSFTISGVTVTDISVKTVVRTSASSWDKLGTAVMAASTIPGFDSLSPELTKLHKTCEA